MDLWGMMGEVLWNYCLLLPTIANYCQRSIANLIPQLIGTLFWEIYTLLVQSMEDCCISFPLYISRSTPCLAHHHFSRALQIYKFKLCSFINEGKRIIPLLTNLYQFAKIGKLSVQDKKFDFDF